MRDTFTLIKHYTHHQKKLEKLKQIKLWGSSFIIKLQISIQEKRKLILIELDEEKGLLKEEEALCK